MTTKLDKWLHSGKHLPRPLRDFHDAKKVFKAMHVLMPGDPDALIKQPDWITGHCYVIDVFLWFMARRGWTLQRSRCDLDFWDLNADFDCIYSSNLRHIKQPITLSPLARTMEVCPTCGNKRCPHATDPALSCTGSNEPDQPGSRYTTPTPGAHEQ